MGTTECVLTTASGGSAVKGAGGFLRRLTLSIAVAAGCGERGRLALGPSGAAAAPGGGRGPGEVRMARGKKGFVQGKQDKKLSVVKAALRSVGMCPIKIQHDAGEGETVLSTRASV